MRNILLAVLVSLGPTLAADDVVPDGSRVLFLGDSNTFDGRFIALLEVHAKAHFPERKIAWINLGLPSETVTGLSEPDHPYPRPDIHTRVAEALKKTKPTLVVACYGMNDGIYYPFSEDRFQKYQQGYRKLIADCEKAGTKVVLMSPAPFDARPVKAKTLAKGAEKYSWLKPYVDYDSEVLTRYSDWQVTLREKGYRVADAHAAMHLHFAKMRKIVPEYGVSADGIHPDASGHFIIFRELASTLGLPITGRETRIDAAAGSSGNPEVSGIKVGPGKLDFTWKMSVSFPRHMAWHPRLAEIENIAVGIGSLRLGITGLPPGKHALYEGDKLIGSATAEQWKAGEDLSKWAELSTNKRTAEMWDLIQKKQRILGLAWLTDVGHKRPDTPKGTPLAEALKYGEEIDERVKKLTSSAAIQLRVVTEK